MKNFLGCVAIIFVILLVVGGGGFFIIKARYDKAISEANSNDNSKVKFIVNSGDTSDVISENLVKEGLLKKENQSYFRYYLRLNKLGSKIQAGSFLIPKNLNIKELALTLQKAGLPDLWITIPEGIRKDEIADIFEDEFNSNPAGKFDKDEFLRLTEDGEFIKTLGLNGLKKNNLEGYLFPDKYLFSQETDAKGVIEKMTENFKTKTGNNLTYDDLIIASLIEREGRSDEDRKIVSDIIRRRVDQGWLLGIDATILYYKKDWKYIITQQDKESNNPYNSYITTELPPTPICNPSLSSIDASLNPTPNKYFFYIHDNNGIPHYAVTLAEHNRNISKYLR